MMAGVTNICNVHGYIVSDFFGDMILKAPSLNIINKLSRSVLSLYSYDDSPDMITPKHEIDTAITIKSGGNRCIMI